MSASNRGTARRRLSLLAGGSLAAATIAVLAGGVALAPTAARADNECGNPGTNGSAADTFQCTDAAPFTSITYPLTNGNLTLQLQNDVTVTTGGIVVAPTGTNSVSITRIADSPANSGDPQITSTTGAGISVIRPTLSASGNITINLSDNDTTDTPMSVTGLTGIRVSNAGTGTTSVTTTNGTITGTAGWGAELGSTGTGNTTFTNRSLTTGTAGAVRFTGGNNATLNNFGGTLRGLVSFENTGVVSFLNLSTWHATGVANFGAGASSFSNTGILAIGGATEGAATLTLSSLETFSTGDTTVVGTILFGANAGLTATDGVANDRLVTAATVLGGGRLRMDVVLGGAQADCSAAVTADCFDLRGGTALGPALGSSFASGTVLINPVAGTGTLGVRQVLVDVSGAGEATERAFVLDPANAGYREIKYEKPLIDAGPVVYRLLYDETAQQFYLIGAPDAETVQLAHLGDGVRATWDLTTGGWLERSANLRTDPDGAGRGVWLSAVAGMVDSNSTQSFSDGSFVFDTSYTQQSYGLVGGVDVLDTGSFRAGVTAGYVTSELEKKTSTLDYELKGYTAGAYASMLAGGVYLDAIVNYASFDVSSDSLSAESEATSLGVQAEVGYRYLTPTEVILEPLVAVAYVSTDVGEAAFANGAVVTFEDATSLRAAVGLRVAGELGEETVTRFSVTGRVWQTFDDEAVFNIEGVNGDIAYEDGRNMVGDLAANVSVLGLAEGLSLDAAARLKFKEDYNVGELSLGFRYAF